MSLVLPLLIILATVLLQALLTGYETGFVSANIIRIRHLAEEENDARAARLLRHMMAPGRMLTMLLIGSNLMIVTCTIVVSMQIRRLFGGETAGFVENIVSAVVIAPALLVFAEIVPKSVFRIHPNRLSLAVLPVIDLCHAVLAPVAIPVSGLTRLLLRAIGARDENIVFLVSSIEDVRSLVDEGVDHGTIEPEEQEMIHSVIDMQTTTAKEIMVPRIHIQALANTARRSELAAFFAETGRTRIPIYHETVDEVVGVANAYSLLLDGDPENEDIARFIREVTHVPDTMKLDDLFRLLKNTKQHLVIVTDEYGGTDGLVTIEDILEEIFGEIQDEYDNEENPIHRVGPHAYSIDARTPLEDVAEAAGIAVEDDEVETVGGLVMHLAGHIPAQGEVIECGRFRLTVLAGGPNFISRVRLEVLPEERKGHEEEA